MILPNPEPTHCVYKLTMPNGKFYYGCTKNLKQRLISHSYNKHQSPKNIEIQKHGIENVRVEVISNVLSEDSAKDLEAELIHEFYNDPLCLNAMNHIGGSTKVAKKISETLKKYHKQGRYSHNHKQNLQPTQA